MAYHYTAPLREMRFVIEQVLQAPLSWAACPSLAELDAETAGAVLEEAARFASEVLQPLNASGDREGCRLDQAGQVHTPAGFRAAYQAFVEGGWPALACSPQWGGQGLPLLLDAALREMLSACNHGWNMYPDLLHGAYETIKAHASEELKAAYLAKVASGEWLAAMALTEPGAGSDLGALRTRAEPQPDGSLRISGQKIFISGGEHDLTENIVHLVLCRLHDPEKGPAPAGSRGLSLALVPKWLPDGSRNRMVCDGIEHKMGIHGSATCAMRYEAATGWLVGEPHRGLQAMFLMMNSARLHVGLQGLGHQEMATQNALRYAFEREQFGQPIAQLPAMRQILLRLQARLEAQRVFTYRAALALDEAAHHPEAEKRQQAQRLAALLTPIVKAACTRHGFESASAALQVFGGYGYVGEYGVEQTLRDSRIAMIYEGTNEIQAIDLTQRKLLADEGLALEELLAELEAEAARCEALARKAASPAGAHSGDPAGTAAHGLGEFAAALREQCRSARLALAGLMQARQSRPEAPLLVADDLLAAMTGLLETWAYAANARAACEASQAADGDPAWASAKLGRMRYGLQWLTPEAALHWQRVREAGNLALPAVALP